MRIQKPALRRKLTGFGKLADRLNVTSNYIFLDPEIPEREDEFHLSTSKFEPVYRINVFLPLDFFNEGYDNCYSPETDSNLVATIIASECNFLISQKDILPKQKYDEIANLFSFTAFRNIHFYNLPFIHSDLKREDIVHLREKAPFMRPIVPEIESEIDNDTVIKVVSNVDEFN